MSSKADNLKEIQALGYKVPAFAVFTANEATQPSMFSRVPKAAKYAVRSSMATEDTDKSSNAGQFLTKLGVAFSDLDVACLDVINQAKSKGLAEEGINVIVQEFIEPEFAGVFFSRDPQGLSNYTCEWVKGRGDKIVSGLDTGKTIKGYYQSMPEQKTPRWLPELALIGQELEFKFGFPQDIEWCYSKGQLYILQSRPITSITKEQYDQILVLEKSKPAGDYFFQKAEVSDTIPRPTPLVFDLLVKIYSAKGPIKKAYEYLGINYQPNPQNLFKIIGNQLYMNQEVSLQSLLPSYSFFPALKPKIKTTKGLLTTLRNQYRLGVYQVPSAEVKFKKIKNLFNQDLKSNDVQSWWQDFALVYQEIFLTNLYTQKLLKKALILSKGIRFKLPELLTIIAENNTIKEFLLALDITNMSGNSLDLADVSKTTKEFSNQHLEVSPALQSWYASLSKFKLQYWEDILTPLKNYFLLRELTRLLTVKHVTQLRSIASDKFKDVADKYITFVKLAELESGKVSKEELKRRYLNYQEANKYTYPSTLCSIYLKPQSALFSISSGNVSGTLITANQLNNQIPKASNLILYCQNLQPEYTKFFPYIKGIVSENGGLLSHLAIMAREAKIPAVSGFIFDINHIGKEISLDADAPELKFQNND